MTGRPGVTFSGERFFLSNFYPHPFTFRGRTYPTAEHAFQAAKCIDAAEAERVRLATSPAAAKQIGRRIGLRPDWDDVRVEVMREVLAAKFADPDLRSRLLATGKRELVEENTWGDRFWGRSRNVGRNMLGRLLMELRESLRSIDAPTFERNWHSNGVCGRPLGDSRCWRRVTIRSRFGAART